MKSGPRCASGFPWCTLRTFSLDFYEASVPLGAFNYLTNASGGFRCHYYGRIRVFLSKVKIKRNKSFKWIVVLKRLHARSPFENGVCAVIAAILNVQGAGTVDPNDFLL